MALFSDLFGEYIDLSLCHEELCRGDVFDLHIDMSKRELLIRLKLDRLFSCTDLSLAEQSIGTAMQVERCRISPCYSPEQFSSEYLPQVIQKLGNSGVPVNGFFEGCKSDLIGDTLRIYLSHGGQAFLEEIRCGQKISQLIKEEFSRDVQVVFDGVVDIASKQVKVRLVV